jgi:class 3 adenylate cyclase
MKRKIAAIFAADIAGYSRLVAEDEEETLRRLASYRQVTDDFISRYGGRIFNTAGDAVLAEFSSAVEAVRCAIDIQESLRTRNLAYPPSRHMSFRIGITIGDVVERDGDLLGDGVNIAARLEGLAEVGGICVSRAVHEQVANKLSVQFADIGAQEVKNIPNPVHAFMVSMKREDGTYAAPLPPSKKPVPQSSVGPNWLWPAVVMVVCLAAIGVGGFLYFTKLEIQENAKASMASSPIASPTAAPAAPEPMPKTAAMPKMPPPMPTTSMPAAPMPPMPAKQMPPPAMPLAEKFAAESIPFVPDRARQRLASDYAPAGGDKALALTISGVHAFAANQANEEAARNQALEQCQKFADAMQPQRKCEVYAVGDTVVYPHGRPPMPPMPWLRRDPLIEKPFSAKDTPIVHDVGKARLEALYPQSRKSRSIAIGPAGQFFFNFGIESDEESIRRNLETCGAAIGTACMIVALDDVFVVPAPMTLRAIGFFQARTNAMIVPEMRDEVMRKLADGNSGWSAVAVGAAGRPGLGLKAPGEQAAINEAMNNCARRDSDCRVIAIGPFLVGPN